MKNVLYIGNKLKNKKFNVSTILILGNLLESEGYNVFYASSKTNKFFRLLDMCVSCIKYKNTANVVLIDTYSTQNFYYALIISQLCRILNLDYIPILHGGNLPERLKRSPLMSKMIFKHAKYNVSPSGFLKNAFQNYGYANILHIPNTIKIDDYPFLLKKYDTPRLLWVRSFSKIYNPELAVKVLNTLRKEYPESELCMVGPDTDGSRQYVENLANSLNLTVKFTGKLEKKDWIDLSKNYNIFINTTNFDNTPVSVIEAMALGLPIVSTNVGGIPYLIEDGVDGLLVEPNQVNEMNSAVVSLIKDFEKRKVLIENARKKAEKFDWNQVKLLWIKALNANKGDNLS
ncbi:glycosyltransferase family 4 protein [Psychroserpens mesophilus]|uniref:glycosyltransferase family 4 protein n=1 Tax=Psychroserpens mesophilus TaxID=325473 RepID=UPI003D6580B3